MVSLLWYNATRCPIHLNTNAQLASILLAFWRWHMSETHQIAQAVANLDFTAIPAEVIDEAKVLILDNIGCGLASQALPWSRMVASLANEASAPGPCTVFGYPWRASPSYATLANGTMIGGFETDHVFWTASCHPGAAVFPALLAIGEKEHLNGQVFLTALVAGYEVICRIGEAATRAVEDVAGFHGPPTNGPFGSAVAVGKALGLDADTLACALGIAGSHSSGLMEFSRDGSMIKRLHVGRASQLGLESALLAQKGITGPTTVLEGTHGFLNVFSPAPKKERLLDGLWEHYRIQSSLMIKTYPCHARAHPFLHALRAFQEKRPLDPNEVLKIRILLDARGAKHHGQLEPTTLLTAQSSIPFSISVALWRDISNPLVFSDDVLQDVNIRRTARLTELVSIDESVEPTEKSLILELSGETHHLPIGEFIGSPTNPYTFDTMCQKFRRYTAASMEQSVVDQIIDAVSVIETSNDIADIASMLSPDA